jgi:adenine-specific DNA-methyltransferase
MKENTGWASFENKRVADLFAGTGVVTNYFRSQGAITIANDAEAYSSIIADAVGCCVFSDRLKTFIRETNDALEQGKHAQTSGFMTTHYSDSRMYFTTDNAKRIDYIRDHIENACLSASEYTFLLASLILSADLVSNTAATYGSYLKDYKTRSVKSLVLTPIHENTVECRPGSSTSNADVLAIDINADLVYLDPPYNNRQYSKNYFPLNMIAMKPSDTAVLTGKTGIPEGCFLSGFCRKEAPLVFDQLFGKLNAEWVFVSYSSEGLLSKEKMTDLLSKHGTVTVAEREYKRYKSNSNGVQQPVITEFLFCLHRILTTK